jgi:uncharacterized DUF497 family protein
MREHPKMDAHLVSASPAERVIICSVVRGEIRYGIERLPQGRRRQELEAKATKRGDRIRIISARELTRTERAQYEEGF